jgi:hypothetical protein
MEFTSLITNPTLDTFVLVNNMLLFALAGNTGNRTVSRTQRTTHTIIIDFISDKFSTNSGRTFFIFNMRLVFILEISQG